MFRSYGSLLQLSLGGNAPQLQRPRPPLPRQQRRAVPCRHRRPAARALDPQLTLAVVCGTPDIPRPSENIDRNPARTVQLLTLRTLTGMLGRADFLAALESADRIRGEGSAGAQSALAERAVVYLLAIVHAGDQLRDLRQENLAPRETATNMHVTGIR